MARVRKPICKLLSKAWSVVGPETVTRHFALNSLGQTRRAHRFGEETFGRQIHDREVVVYGGRMYLL